MPVMGTTSPYPTVVNVATAHHMDATMLGNACGWMADSIKYIAVEATISNSRVSPAETSSSCLRLRITAAMDTSERLYRLSLKTLRKRRTRRARSQRRSTEIRNGR